MDYKILLGAEVKTKDIEAGVKKYNKPLELRVIPNMKSLETALKGYKPVINVNTKLSTKGITEAIRNYQAKNNIKVGVEPDLTGVNTKIESYVAKPLRVQVELNWTGVKGQIANPTENLGKVKLDAELNTSAVSDAVKNFNKENSAAKIKVGVEPDFSEVNTKISNYEVKSKLKIHPKLLVGEITKDIKEYQANNPEQYILLNAKLKDQALNAEINNYKLQKKIPVDLTLGYTTDFDTKVSQKLNAYQAIPIEIPVRLKPAKTGFDSQITKKLVKVEAELAPDAINKAIEGHKPTSKMPVEIRLVQPKDINAQVRSLVKPTESFDVGIKLDEATINASISSFKPTAMLNIQPNLILEDIDRQITAYVPKAPLRVNVQVDNSDLDKKAGKKNAQKPVRVDVKLDLEKINGQIRSFKTNNKIKVDVKLNLDGVKQQIEQVKVDTPVKLPVELDNSNVQSQIDSIRRQLEKLGNIKIDLIGVGNDSKENIGGEDNTTDVTHRGIPTSNIAQNFKEANIEIKAVDGAIENLGIALNEIGLDKSVIKSMTKDFEELGVTVTNITSRLNGDGSVRLTVKGLDQFKDAVTLVGNVDAEGNIGAWTETISRDVNKVTENFNRLKSLIKDIGNLKLDRIETNDPNEISRLTQEIDRLQKEYDELYAAASPGFKSNQLQQLENMAKSANTAVEELQNNLAESINAKLVGSGSGLSQFDNEIGEVTSRFNQLTNQTAPLKTALDGVESAFQRVKEASKSGNQEGLIRANREYEAALKSVNTQLEINERAQKESIEAQKLADDRVGFQAKIDAWLTKNSAAAKQFGAQLRNLQAQAKNCDRVTLDHLEREFKQIDKEAEAAGKRMQSFGDRLKLQVQRYGAYFSVATLVMRAVQAARSMFEQVKLIDSAMTELKKVTDETDASYNKFLSNAASKAKELGTTIDGLVSSTADFARLGYGFEDAQELAEVANIYAVVGDEIEGIDEATKSLISTLAAFKNEASGISDADFAMDIIDKFNEVANNFAISSGGIGEAMERSASSLRAANNTIDESIALVTAANTVVQHPEAVGTAFKTISMRIRGAKTELEEAGLETEGMVESTAKLRQEILALSGVDIMLDKNNFKSTYQIMDELAQKWDSLTDIQQASVTELIAGKRQGNIVSSLMQNFDTARDALNTSLNSSGSAMREHEKWQQSLEARINSLKASWQSLSQTFMSSDFLKKAIDHIIHLVDAIDSLIDHFGVLGTAVGGFSLYNIFKKGFAVDSSGNQIGAYFNIFKGLGEKLSVVRSAFNANIKASDTFADKLRAVGMAGADAGRNIKKSFNESAGTIKMMIADIGKALAVVAIIKAVQDISSWLSELRKEAETSAEKFDKISEELSSVDSELRSLESELSSVESQIDELLKKDELTFTEQEELDRLRDISNELERQIELTETLQKSLQKSQSDVAMSAYGDYLEHTSFYSNKSKEDRKEEAKSTGSAIGNIAGIIIGAAIAYFTGGASVLTGAGIGSLVGSGGGNILGGIFSDASYDNEVTVGDMFDKMHIERLKLKKAADDAEKAYKEADEKDRANLRAQWEEASAALNEFDTSLGNHASQVSQYLNSVNYNLLSNDQKEKYIKYSDYLSKYNIEMGVKGAKTTALDRYFSDELITQEAKELRLVIETALNSGEDIHFFDLEEDIVDANSRLKEMGITLTDVISYFRQLEEAQIAASNYDTYDMVSSIAVLSDGVEKLTEAFKEFNETGIVSARTLVELHEIFGNLGEIWTNYVDLVSSGTASIWDIQDQTELLAEEHLNNLFKNGGLKFVDDNGEYDIDKYKTYLSTINQLEQIGVENAKEYIDALQQQAMIQDAVKQRRADIASIDTLSGKESPTEKEIDELERLKAKIDDFDGYIADVELRYGVKIKNTGMFGKEVKLSSYQEKIKEYNDYVSKIKNLYNPEEFLGSLERSDAIVSEYIANNQKIDELESKGVNTLDTSWYEAWEAVKETVDIMTPGFLDVHTAYDKYQDIKDDIEAQNKSMDEERSKRQEIFDNLIDIANKNKIDLDGINVDNFDINDWSASSYNESYNIVKQVYERVKDGLEGSDYDGLIKETEELETEINDELNNLGLEIDFGRNFNQVILDGLDSSLEQLGTAMSESISGSGLSSDSITAIENLFGDLNGYDDSSLFENTANGIRLNREEFRKLNSEFKTSNVDDLEGKMSVLEARYKQTKEKLHDCVVGTDEYNSAIRDLSHIEEQISATEELISQYKGVFSAYQEWQRMESSGQERDMYEGLIKGFENVDDEISRGWLDDGTIEFLELLTGKDLSTAPIEELKNAYAGLDEQIGNSKYSIRDFFTVDEDGNSTNTGVYNFLETIESEIDGVINRNKNGKIVGFNFEVAGGNEAIAKALGISEELVEIMVRASDDAGFVVDVDGAVTQISHLKEQAESAVESLVLLKNNGLKELEGVDVNFNIDADDGELVSQQKEAIDLLEKFKKDGKIDFSMEGAEEALEIAKYLTIRLDSLTEPRYMEIDMSTVEKDLREPIKKMQEFEELSSRKHLLTLTGDTEGLKDVEDKMEEISSEIEKLDDETKLKLGIDTGWTKEQISKALESGEIEIPAQVELDIQMSDDLKDMRLMMMRQLNLISQEEVELKIKYNIDDSIVNGLTQEQQEVIVKYFADHKEVDSWSPEQKEAFVKYIVDGGDPEKYVAPNKDAAVNYEVNDTKVQEYKPSDFFATVWLSPKKAVSDLWNWVTGSKKEEGDSGLNGTANAYGTVGKAFRQGDWRTKKSERALVGELGREIVVTPNNRWHTVGDNGAEFVNIPRGSIIFNHKQTEELLANGKVSSNGGRGRAYASGTAYAMVSTSSRLSGAKGDGGLGKVVDAVAVGAAKKVKDLLDKKEKQEKKNSKTASTGNGGGTDKKDGNAVGDNKEFEESFDWIEIAISRVEREIDNLDKKASSIYKSWSKRNSALAEEIEKVGKEIELQESAAQRYLKEANDVGLDAAYAKKVRNGTIDIQDFKGEGDEKLLEKIKDYQKWYELYLKCKDAATDLREEERKLYAQRFDNTKAEYDSILQDFEHTEAMLNEYISQAEAKGHIVSKEYYNALISNENANIAKLEEKRASLIAERNKAEVAGIDKTSQSWRDMCADIDSVTQEIEEGTTSIIEYSNAIRDIDWEVFDLIQERISDVTAEADFLIELMSNKKLFNDNGKLTDQGLSTMGLHAQNYNTHMYQADEYGAEITKLDAQIASDPYDQELINRRRELIEAQRESILNAENEKNAIRDLVEEGINLELDALQERIDLHNEELDSMKDLYDYQKRVKEQTEEISSLEKQMAAYGGDNSEEAKAKIQELKVSLDDAKANLEETELDRYISSQQSLLDSLYTEYETILNTRLDNVDALLTSIVAEVNTSASTIKTTLETETGKVGTMLSTEMSNIWGDSGKAKSVVTTYGEDFRTKSTTTNTTLGNIKFGIDNMVKALNKDANKNANTNKTSSSSQKDPTGNKPTTPKPTTPAPKPTSSIIKVGGKINAGNAKIYDYAGAQPETQYFKKDPVYKVLKAEGNWLQVRWHKLSKGITGWFKKGDVKALATGAKKIDANDMAWTQEKGQEYIVRPSDGAILTPVARGDSVLNATASNNIWDMANSPAEFIRDNLKLSATSVPNNSNVHSNYTQHFDKVVFNLPNVKNYDELLSAMQKDKSFEKLITSMTIDRIAGGSSLAKGKSIR